MKIIGHDNLDRDDVAEWLVADNIKDERFAKIMCDALNKEFCADDYAPYFYRVVPDDHKLWRGMKEFV